MSPDHEPAHPPERLSDGSIVIRRARVGDAPSFHQAVTSSVDHLRPWMPWIASEPLDLADRQRLLAEWERDWSRGTQFPYLITRAADEAAALGACGLHRRIGAGGLEIGYWVAAGEVGRGIATAAARLAIAGALTLDDITHVEIHHDAANEVSGRIPAGLGFTRVRVVENDSAPEAPGDSGVSWIWRLERPEIDRG